MCLSLQPRDPSPRTRALSLTLFALAGMVAATARGSSTPQLSVVPREDLVDGQVVEISITGAPARETLSLDTCVKTDLGLACSAHSRSMRILPSGTYGPVAEKVRSILVTSGARYDCRERAVDSPCLLVLRLGQQQLASAPLFFRLAAPLEVEPSLSITPTADLRDGQTVSVVGRGFDVSVHTGVRQCRAGSDQPADCRPSGRSPSTSDTGTLRQEVLVYAGFGTLNDDWVDCAQPGSCELVVFNGRAEGGTARVPLSFARGTRIDAPRISVAPSGTLRDGDELTISGEGFSPDATLSLEQYVVRGGGNQERWHQLISNGFIGTSSRGTFAAKLKVRSRAGDGSRVCTDDSSCVLAAREMQGRYGIAKASLRFER